MSTTATCLEVPFGSSHTYTVGRLHHGTWHRFTVAAVDAAGNESAPSPRITVRATYLPPP